MLMGQHLPKLPKDKNESWQNVIKKEFLHFSFKKSTKNPHLRNMFTILTVSLFEKWLTKANNMQRWYSNKLMITDM